MSKLPVAKKTWLAAAIAAAITGLAVHTYINKPATEPLRQPQGSASQTASTTGDLQQALQLARSGRTKEALDSIDRYLDQNPGDLKAQLSKSQILLEDGAYAAAHTLLRRLIEQFPERPEPLNNLAVLLAQEGRYNDAVDTLLQAFETHPSYARVQRNLSELYATLASRAYSKALDLQNEISPPQLALLHEPGSNQPPGEVAGLQLAGASAAIKVAALDKVAENSMPAPVDSGGGDTGNTADGLQPAAAVAALAAAPETIATSPDTTLALPPTPDNLATDDSLPLPTVADIQAEADSVAAVIAEIERSLATPPATKARAPQPVATEAEPPQPAIATAKDTAETAETAAAPVVSAKPAEQEAPLDPRAEVLASVEAWADAWSRKDSKRYIDAYVLGYQPNDNTSHNQWKQQRRSRLSRPKFIQVKLSDIEVEMLSQKMARVTFSQRYRSDSYSDRTRKQMELALREGRWKIVSERSR